MKTLIPYLHFNGTCEDALKFYAEAFSGKVTQISRFTEGPMQVPDAQKNQVMHARFEAENIRFMASDSIEKKAPGSTVGLSIDFTDRDEMERVWAKLEKGGTVKMPLGDQFWGARFGMVEDKFGVGWMLNAETKK